MKKLFLALLMVLVFCGAGYGQVLTLNSAETLAVPTATKLDLRNINIDVTNKLVTVTYRFIDAGGADIPMAGSGGLNRTWTCRDTDAIPAFNVATCTGAGVPDPCCTGVGTGTGCYAGAAAQTCFTDTFSFVMRTQDVGTQIGKGLRALIWSKMRPAVLTGTNNATLP
jgi:tetrahydromethanopterin S-methyltransferase subunit D